MRFMKVRTYRSDDVGSLNIGFFGYGIGEFFAAHFQQIFSRFGDTLKSGLRVVVNKHL